MIQGILLELLRDKGLKPLEAAIVKFRFQAWLYTAPYLVTPVTRSHSRGHVYEFDALAEPWQAYRTMRESKGQGLIE
jgi:hypothetical protein